MGGLSGEGDQLTVLVRVPFSITWLQKNHKKAKVQLIIRIQGVPWSQKITRLVEIETLEDEPVGLQYQQVVQSLQGIHQRVAEACSPHQAPAS